MCSKPVSTIELDPKKELFCKECEQELKEDEQTDLTTKRGMEKAERDDEEEWGRVPIPQSDDSYSSDEWLSEEPKQCEPTSSDDEDQSQKGYLNCFVAFLIAPRKDGRILTKEGKIIDVNDGPARNERQQATTWSKEIPVIAPTVTQHHWTKHLIAFQRHQLRKGYRKHQRPKVMMKLMRQVQRYRQTGKIKREFNSSQDISIYALTTRDKLSYNRYDSTR
jgi:hypothetical protein